MKMEDHFKETLQRAVANEPPVLDAWDRFERRAGRSRQRRLFAAIAAGAAIAVASVIVVPRLGTGDGGIGLATQPPSPSPTLTQKVDPYEGWSSYEYALYRFTLRHPTDWSVKIFEADPEVVAPGQKATAAGEPTMAVTLTLLNVEFDDPELRREGFDRSTRPDGRPFVRAETILDGGAKVVYRIDWSTCLRTTATPSCERKPETLIVAILAGTDALWERYGPIAERIVSSIEYFKEAVPVQTTG